jgi:uncharacterized protein (DUF427 family)
MRTVIDAVQQAAEPAYRVQERRIPDGLWIEPSPRRVRTYFGGRKIADSQRALLVFEPHRPPTYWFPMGDVRLEHLTSEDRAGASGMLFWTLRVGDRLADKAARSAPDPSPDREALSGHIAFTWHLMDAWYEEDDEVFAGPANPYHRVDVLRSSRHIRVEVAGQVVAESTRPALLLETGLPTRYYLPKQDVRMDLFVPTDTSTSCPYKGVACYWSLRIGDDVVKDVVWAYPAPVPECSKIANLVSFYNEKVDIYVDGQREERPRTKWS